MAMIRDDWREQILALCEIYCEIYKISPVTLGFKIARNGRLFPQLSKGKTITVDTYIQIMKWFREHRPNE